MRTEKDRMLPRSHSVTPVHRILRRCRYARRKVLVLLRCPSQVVVVEHLVRLLRMCLRDFLDKVHLQRIEQISSVSEVLHLPKWVAFVGDFGDLVVDDESMLDVACVRFRKRVLEAHAQGVEGTWSVLHDGGFDDDF
jgi:hypothetical protein